MANAFLNDPAACGLLGTMYLFGQGVHRDGGKAEYWLTKSAERGFVSSQSLLGTMYATGLGVANNPDKATLWLTKAASQGDEKARALLESLPRRKSM
ncbi:MAG: tetratricopeptide repeat protein [Burkholderiales bacterium]